MKPVEIDAHTFAFGTPDGAGLLPKHIPAAVSGSENPWLSIADRVLKNGFGPTPAFRVLPGIKPLSAIRHLGAIMASPIPDPIKIQAMAYLMETWFTEIFWPETDRFEPEDILKLAA